MLLPSRNLIHSTIFAASHSYRPSVLYAATPVAAPPSALIDIITYPNLPRKYTINYRTRYNHFSNPVRSLPVTTAPTKTYSVVTQKIINLPLRSPQVATLQPHITAAYNFHDFPYFPAFPHFQKNSPFPPFPVKPKMGISGSFDLFFAPFKA